MDSKKNKTKDALVSMGIYDDASDPAPLIDPEESVEKVSDDKSLESRIEEFRAIFLRKNNGLNGTTNVPMDVDLYNRLKRMYECLHIRERRGARLIDYINNILTAHIKDFDEIYIDAEKRRLETLKRFDL